MLRADCEAGMGDALLSVEEALQRVLAAVHTLEDEEVDTLAALGRVLAEDIVADFDVPPFPNSAMDGYAVRAADTAGAAADHPVELRVIADIPAGDAQGIAVTAGSASRIMTGAPLPPGADAVVPVEWTDEPWTRDDRPLPERVRVFRAVSPQAHVRPAGEDIQRGETVLRRGSKLRPQEIGVLAALGRPRVRVVRRPRVAILATGDELVDIAAPLGPGQIHDSNSYTLAALVENSGGVPIRLGIARDRLEEVRARLRAGLEQGADLFLSSAGVSVGAYDVVKAALEAEGELAFWRVNMRPGKPLAFARVRDVPFLGLPGNPVSAAVAFEVFARPAILKMGGRTALARPRVEAILDEPVRSDGRESYLRAVVTRRNDGYHAVITGPQSSGILTSLVRANALLVVPAGVRQVPAGNKLQAVMLDWPEEVF
ncbi:MAG: molybdopterin molybdenumtransferase MoeA [Chloroflexota bacterium]